MMKRSIKWLSLALLVSFVFSVAFAETLNNMSLYLIDGENLSMVSYENFSLNNTNYSLIWINGSAALLVNANTKEIIESKSQMNDILWPYFLQKYSPGNLTEIEEQIRELVSVFNWSRNNGDQVKNVEEYACRGTLGENIGIPPNLHQYKDIYAFYSSFICSHYGEILTCKDYMEIYPDVKSFFTSSYDIDKQLATILQDLNVSDYRLISANYDEISSAVDAIDKDVDTIKHSIFRYPLDRASCPNCIGICAELVVNETALHKIKTLAGEVSEKTKPLYKYDDILTELYNSTQERLAYKHTYEERTAFSKSKAQILAGWPALKERADTVLSKIADAQLSNRVQQIEQLNKQIDEKIEGNNFTGLNESLSMLSNIVYLVANQTKMYETKLSELNEKRMYLEGLYISYRNSIHDPILKEKTEDEYSAVIAALNGRLTPSQFSVYDKKLDELIKTYESVSTQEKHSVIKAFLDGMVWYGKAIYETISPFLGNNLSYKLGIIENSPLIFGSLIGGAFASIVLWVSVVQFYTKEKKHRRIKRGRRIFFFTLALIGAAIVFVIMGGATYIALDNAIHKADIPTFTKVIAGGNHIYVVVQAEKEGNIETCGEEIAQALRNEGENVTVVEKVGNTCKIDGKDTVMAECSKYSTPAIILSEATTNQVEGSYIFEPILRISMTDSSYKECYVKEVLTHGQ